MMFGVGLVCGIALTLVAAGVVLAWDSRRPPRLMPAPPGGWRPLPPLTRPAAASADYNAGCADQRARDLEIIRLDHERNWMFSPGQIACCHTILMDAIQRGEVPAGPSLPHQ